MAKYEQGKMLRRVTMYLGKHPEIGAFTTAPLAVKMRLPVDHVYRTINLMRMLGYVDTKPSRRAIHNPLTVRLNEHGYNAAIGFRQYQRRGGKMPKLDATALMESMIVSLQRKRTEWQDVPVDQS